MSNDKMAWNLLQSYAKKNSRLSILIPIIFAITGVTTIIGGVLLSNTDEEAIRFLYIPVEWLEKIGLLREVI
ncbi:hypothetical protein QGM71_16945 [Virgibacillus sp. C22-A2]|uniref:ABC transporter permease n=1 Tax=Virgibacillus tibetensis TaxID=3042313 RepID=A0ABU6KJW5_9BACI|nr:hypothetical protein [Virgibacillus sp. C22-A2]